MLCFLSQLFEQAEEDILIADSHPLLGPSLPCDCSWYLFLVPAPAVTEVSHSVSECMAAFPWEPQQAVGAPLGYVFFSVCAPLNIIAVWLVQVLKRGVNHSPRSHCFSLVECTGTVFWRSTSKIYCS